MSAPLEANNVSLDIGSAHILQDVTLHAQKGLTVLLGPNGAGKTTLLRVVSGFLRPMRGAVLLCGKPMRTYSARQRARRIAVVSQQPAFEYAFSVLDVVLMGRTPWKRNLERDNAEDLRLATAALEQTGMLALRDRPITQLSGGERQRVFISRALCQNTPILLLDEPVSALDLRHQTGIMQTLRDAVDLKGLTCVCVLHDLNLAAHYADRICLMRNGRIAFDGAPSQVLIRDIIEDVYETQVRILEDEGELYILPAGNRRDKRNTTPKIDKDTF